MFVPQPHGATLIVSWDCLGGAPPENCTNNNQDAPEESCGDRNGFDSPPQK